MERKKEKDALCQVKLRCSVKGIRERCGDSGRARRSLASIDGRGSRCTLGRSGVPEGEGGESETAMWEEKEPSSWSLCEEKSCYSSTCTTERGPRRLGERQNGCRPYHPLAKKISVSSSERSRRHE